QHQAVAGRRDDLDAGEDPVTGPLVGGDEVAIRGLRAFGHGQRPPNEATYISEPSRNSARERFRTSPSTSSSFSPPADRPGTKGGRSVGFCREIHSRVMNPRARTSSALVASPRASLAFDFQPSCPS